MRNRILSGLRVAFALAVFGSGFFLGEVVATSQENPVNLEGSWLGTLDVGSAKLRLVFRFSPNSDGGWKAVLVSVDQGGQEIPADNVVLENRKVTVPVSLIGGSFEGSLSDDNKTITGSWKQSGVTLPLSIKQGQEEPVAARPQDPKKPFPYLSEEVHYTSGKEDGIKIAGTLTLPKDNGPHPAVILISGSGPQDRDETVFGHRPFLVLSDYLTRHGIAVLRTDDRGVGGSSGSFETATSEDTALDVESGLAFLKTRPEIDPKRIGLIGHSEGGLVAPLVAAKGNEVAFLVLMAAPGLTGEEILYLQGELLAKVSGLDETVIDGNRRLQAKVFEAVKSEPDPAALEAKMRTVVTEWLQTADEQSKRLVGDPETLIRSQTRLVGSPWFRYFLTHDPRPVLERVTCPVLALNGEKDLQVPAQANLEAIRAALVKGGNTHFDTSALPGLNHLFQHAQTGAPAEYGTIEETISPAVLTMIAEWINSR